jgi:hypothetical protein
MNPNQPVVDAFTDLLLKNRDLETPLSERPIVGEALRKVVLDYMEDSRRIFATMEGWEEWY